MNADPFQYDDAAYVLGALSPAQRRAFEEHLSDCAACMRRVGELAGMPALLAGLPEPAFTGIADAPPLPDTVLPNLLNTIRRRRRVRVLALAAAAAVVVVAVALVGVLHFRSDTEPQQSVASQAMTQVAQQRLTATVGVEAKAWGSAVHLTCTYAGGGPASYAAPSYALIVRTRDGATQQIATWRAVPGRTLQVDAATDVDPADIAGLDVVASGTDRRVLTSGPPRSG